MIILKRFSSKSNDEKKSRKPRMPRAEKDPNLIEAGLAGFTGAYYGSKLGKGVGAIGSIRNQRKDFYDRVNKYGDKILNKQGDNFKNFAKNNKRYVDACVNLKSLGSERTRKAIKKGAIIGAAIPIGLTTLGYMKQRKKYKEGKARMDKYKEDYKNWKEQNDTKKD